MTIYLCLFCDPNISSILTWIVTLLTEIIYFVFCFCFFYKKSWNENQHGISPFNTKMLLVYRTLWGTKINHYTHFLYKLIIDHRLFISSSCSVDDKFISGCLIWRVNDERVVQWRWWWQRWDYCKQSINTKMRSA